MTLAETINRDLTTAMKQQDALRLSVLRMIKSAMKLKQVEGGKPLADEEAHAVLRTLGKQRREAAEAFRAAGRADLAQKELAELTVVESYLPASATEVEMVAAVQAAVVKSGAASPKDMGKVMKIAMAGLAGKTVDGKRLSEMVRARLAAG